MSDPVFVPIGYGDPPEELVGDTKATTKCDLDIPHKHAASELARVVGSLKDVNQGQASEIIRLCDQIDKNFEALEQWAGYFLRHCICHCQEYVDSV